MWIFLCNSIMKLYKIIANGIKKNMKIFTGLFDHMVMQRDSNNLSCQTVTGTCDSNIDVIAKCFNEKGIKTDRKID